MFKNTAMCSETLSGTLSRFASTSETSATGISDKFAVTAAKNTKQSSARLCSSLECLDSLC